jgi:hypothetical protein
MKLKKGDIWESRMTLEWLLKLEEVDEGKVFVQE